MASEAFCAQMLRVQTAMNLKWFWQPHSALTGGIEGPPLFFFFFLQLYFSVWISPMGNLDCFPQGKPAATESCYPTNCVCWVLWCFHDPLNSNMDYRIINMRRDINACDCTCRCMDTVRESALKVDSGRKIPLPHRGVKPPSAACRSDAVQIELQLGTPHIQVLR